MSVVLFICIAIVSPNCADEVNLPTDADLEKMEISGVELNLSLDQFSFDRERKVFVDSLISDGYSDEDIAKKIAYTILEKDPNLIERINESKMKIDKQKKKTEEFEKKIRELGYEIYDEAILKSSPQYWPYIVASKDEKKALLDAIAHLNSNSSFKGDLKASFKAFWKKYPVIRRTDGNITHVFMKKKVIKKFNETDTRIFSIFDEISAQSLNEGVGLNWATPGGHYSFIAEACEMNGFPYGSPDYSDIQEHSIDPDFSQPFWSSWYPSWAPYYYQLNQLFKSPDHAWDQSISFGGAPTGCSIYQWDSIIAYRNGMESEAVSKLGWSSHFLTDVGNPMHTGKEIEQALDYNSYGMYNIHEIYEKWVSRYWYTDFDSSTQNLGYKWQWEYMSLPASVYHPSHADEATRSLGIYSRGQLETLYQRLKTYRWQMNDNDRNNDDPWIREMTKIWVEKTQLYANGLVASTMLIPMPGISTYPRDVDDDMRFEDINGNQILDFNDVILYYQNMNFIDTRESKLLFDYTADGVSDYDDVVALFYEVGLQ